ncbi:MAG TPA: 23S rRNA (pseudouridine(1915)-N(3))-methyltransferase RlmH [Steroidobacteraceae bacterium]|nr:23S rRNA (pseudouridine(1915)-N(3))-methyltransferase RlmH [Steroidobacteraceae bacterium]
MLVRLLAAGTRLPSWVNAGYEEYAGRMGPEIRLELVEIAVARRGRNADLARLRAEEGRRMLGGIGPRMYVAALDPGGRQMSTEQLAGWLSARLGDGRDLALMVGGPDGLDPACLARADTSWSLSALTFPHGLVRVIVAEQLYRALSLLKGHPYHRA